MKIFSTKKFNLLVESIRKSAQQDQTVKRMAETPPIKTPFDIGKFLEKVPKDFSTVEALRYLDNIGSQKQTGVKAILKRIWERAQDLTTVALSDITFDEARLYRIQKSIVKMYREDTLIRSIGNLLKQSVIGDGITFSTGNQEIDDYLRLFWSKEGVDFETKQKEIMLHRYLLGEYFLVWFINEEESKVEKDGVSLPDIKIRKFFPWEITAIKVNPDDDEDGWGVVRKSPDDVKERTYRFINQYLYPDRFDYVDLETPEPNAWVQYVKLSDGFTYRGYPQVYVLLKWATVIRELIYDVAQKFHEWSKVIYVLTVKSKGKDWSSDTGRRAPAGGTVVVNSDDAKWDTFESKMDAEGIATVWQTIMYYFSAGAGFPYQYIVHDYSHNNLASSREARVPFVQIIREQQDTFSEECRIFLKVALVAGVRAGILPEEVEIPTVKESARALVATRVVQILKETDDFEQRVEQIKALIHENKTTTKIRTVDIPVDCVFPRVSTMTEKEQAEVARIWKEIGFDMETISTTVGLSWEGVKARKLAEIDFQAELQDKRNRLINQGMDFNPEDEPGDEDEPDVPKDEPKDNSDSESS